MDDGALVELLDRLFETPRWGLSRDENAERLRRDPILDGRLELPQLSRPRLLGSGGIGVNGELLSLPPGEGGGPRFCRLTVGQDDSQRAGVERGASGEVGRPDEAVWVVRGEQHLDV